MEDYNVIDQLNKLSPREYRKFTLAYLNKLSKSIVVEWNYAPHMEHVSSAELYEIFTNCEGFGDSRNGRSWSERSRLWMRKGNGYFCGARNRFVPFKATGDRKDYEPYSDVIIFDSMALKALEEILKEGQTPSHNKTTKQKETINKEKKEVSLAEEVLQKNKDSAKLAGKLAVGKTANEVLLAKLVETLPWTTRFFKGKEIKRNPFAKLAAANLANTLSLQFNSQSPKLKYISEAMVDEAMVDLTINSNMLKDLITQVENSVSLPEGLLDKLNGGQEVK